MNIGVTIKDIRKKRGMSQQELAELSGISQTYLSQIEKGDRQCPTIEVLHNISDALDLPFPVMEFLALDYSKIETNKLKAIKRIETAVNAFIIEFVKSDDKKRKQRMTHEKELSD